MDVASVKLEERRYIFFFSFVLSVTMLPWRVSTFNHVALILLQEGIEYDGFKAPHGIGRKQ